MMRRIFVAIALVSLAACDNGGVVDQTIRQGVRQSAVQTCIAWIPQSDIAAAAGLDPDRLCACAADRALDREDGSVTGNLPGIAEIRAAAAQCVSEIQADAGGDEAIQP